MPRYGVPVITDTLGYARVFVPKGFGKPDPRYLLFIIHKDKVYHGGVRNPSGSIPRRSRVVHQALGPAEYISPVKKQDPSCNDVMYGRMWCITPSLLARLQANDSEIANCCSIF